MMLTVMSCKTETKPEDVKASEDLKEGYANGNTNRQNDGLITIQGQFVYYGDAAILQTSTKLIGVVTDKKMHDLEAQVQQYKKEPTDMVPVTVRGRLFKKPADEEGWEDRIEIKEVLKVSAPKPGDNEVIKLENKQQ